MAARPGDILRTYDPNEYAKLLEIDRLSKGKTKKPGSEAPGLRRVIKAHPRIFVLMIALVVLTIGARAVAETFVRVPSVPAHGVIPNCPTQEIPKDSSVVANTTGFELATCPGGSGLFHILAGTNATANYTLPSPYLDLYAFPASQMVTTRCTDAPSAVDLSRPWIAGFTGNWSLCSDYGLVGESGLPGFSVGWVVA